jgi:nicotinate-nucleotide pyrophosphorylase (carboxylating)
MRGSPASDLESLYVHLTRSGHVQRLLQLAYEEDMGARGDITSQVCIPDATVGEGVIVARQAGVVSGVRLMPAVLEMFAPGVYLDVRAPDGRRVRAGDTVAVVRGPLREVLAAERTLLNFLGRLSGIATLTARFVEAVAGTGAKILDTRKTTPGLRALEKYAVACGGGESHRFGLFDAVLIKDNHLAGVTLQTLARLVTGAAARARAAAADPAPRGRQPGPGEGALRFVEVEVDSLEQLKVILDAGGCGVDAVLLDNMAVATLREAVRMRETSGVSVLLEASGGVNLETVGNIATTGVDFISAGQLTHSAVSLDVALDVKTVVEAEE